MDMVPVYVGLDYHVDTIRVCLMTEEGDVLVNRNIENNTGALRELVQDHHGLVRGVAIEACGGSAEFASQLIDLTEWTVKLAHAGAVERLKKGPDKTDKGDAWHLANLLRVKYLPEVWLADHETRQLRRLLRYRHGLVATQKDIKLRILSLLREECVPNSSEASTWTKTWLAWVKTVSLGEQARWVMDQELQHLEQIQKQVAEAEDRMRAAVKDDPVFLKLMDQAGVALITAFTLRAVVGRFDRFDSGKQLSRYCGVTPCNASSGKKQGDAGLIDAGHDILRPMLIQLAKRLPRMKDEQWATLSRELRKRKPANVVAAALANRWLRKLYHVLVPKPQDQDQAKVQAS